MCHGILFPFWKTSTKHKTMHSSKKDLYSFISRMNRVWKSCVPFHTPESLAYLSVLFCSKNLNIGHNFWIIRDRDIRFDFHTLLLNSLQVTSRSIRVTMTFNLNIAILASHWGSQCFTNTALDLNLIILIFNTVFIRRIVSYALADLGVCVGGGGGGASPPPPLGKKKNEKGQFWPF